MGRKTQREQYIGGAQRHRPKFPIRSANLPPSVPAGEERATKDDKAGGYCGVPGPFTERQLCDGLKLNEHMPPRFRDDSIDGAFQIGRASCRESECQYV